MPTHDFSLIYVWENMYHAMQALIGPGELKQRLTEANGHINGFDIKEDISFVPEVIQGEFEKFLKDIRASHPDSMNEGEMVKQAESIVNMFDLISRHHGPYSLTG